MRRHPGSLVQAFDGGRGGTDNQLLSHQAMRDAVEVMVHLDVVIDMHPGLEQFGKLIGVFGERQHRRAVEFLEAAASAAGQFAEGTIVEQFQPLPDGGVGFVQTEEGALAQPSQDEALGDQHAPFDLGLVLGATNAGGNDGGAVIVGAIGIGGIEVRLVAAGLADT